MSNASLNASPIGFFFAEMFLHRQRQVLLTWCKVMECRKLNFSSDDVHERASLCARDLKSKFCLLFWASHELSICIKILPPKALYACLVNAKRKSIVSGPSYFDFMHFEPIFRFFGKFEFSNFFEKNSIFCCFWRNYQKSSPR